MGHKVKGDEVERLDSLAHAMAAVGLSRIGTAVEDAHSAYVFAVMDLLKLVAQAPEWIASKAMLITEAHRANCALEDCAFDDPRNMIEAIDQLAARIGAERQ